MSREESEGNKSEAKKEPEPTEAEKELIEFAARANTILEEVVTSAYASGIQNGPYHSAHEAFSELHQAMDTIKSHVWRINAERDFILMERDLSNLAAICLRMILDCCRKGDILYSGKE